MEQFTIIPLRVGLFKGIERSNLTYQMNAGEKMVAPVIMYVIKGRDKVILVDTGPSDEEWAAKYHHGLIQTEEMKPVTALKNIGIKPEDIELIVNTHLHWDHSFNNHLFPKAKIYVQRKEMQYAIAPLPPHWVFYESYQLGLKPQWLKAMERIEAVDGDRELVPGIQLVTLPGHTPGFHGVLVNTAKGQGLIASDCCGLFANWQGSGLHKHIPSGIHYSLSDYYKTFEKMEKICDFILPGHDPEVFNQTEYP
jgi:N-acyl homoserine lactone hydrolase